MNKNIVNSIRKKIAKVRNLFLRNRNFTIISDNCWGGFVYQNLDLEYRTPFIGLFIHGEDYVRMLKNLKLYLGQSLVFIEPSKSKYKDRLKSLGIFNAYPIALLDDVELHFMHYKTIKEAEDKWYRRLSRINYDNLIIKFWEGDCASSQDISDFNSLPFKNKFVFTSYNSELESVINIANDKTKTIDNEWLCFKRKFHVVPFINSRTPN